MLYLIQQNVMHFVIFYFRVDMSKQSVWVAECFISSVFQVNLNYM